MRKKKYKKIIPSELYIRKMQNKKVRARRLKYDPQDIINKMLEWSKKEDSLNFVGFCADIGLLPVQVWTWKREYPEFKEAFEIVGMRLAARREKLANENKLNYGSFMRYQGMYDPFLYNFEGNEKDKDAERKKSILEKENMNLVTLADMIAKRDSSEETE